MIIELDCKDLYKTLWARQEHKSKMGWVDSLFSLMISTNLKFI